jgi:acylphosphatase
MVRQIVTVRGRVQGVFFRDTCVWHAGRFSVAGSVRNLPDPGAVEIDVQGDPDEIERFICACVKEAPPRARVQSVESRNAALDQTRRGFTRM